MIERFFPDEYVKSIFHIDYDSLLKKGIRYLIFDIDNTIEPYDVNVPSEKDVKLLLGLKKKGFTVILVSNNKSSRVGRFNEKLKLPAVSNAMKPLTGPVKKALRRIRAEKSATAFIGDQVFTDVWCARRIGVYSILVNPIADKDEFTVRLKRGLEKKIIKKFLKQRI